MEPPLFERITSACYQKIALTAIKKLLDNHFKVRYKLIKKSEIQESGGLAPHILSISCKVADVGCRCKKS
jgi:hypothetical protein